AVAAVFEAQQVSYRELNARANQLAHHLLSLGVQPDDRVAICVERSLDMIVGLLGIMKAGAAYVPLDPAYPADRLAYMLEDCAPVALLSQQALRDVLPTHSAPLLMLDDVQTRDALALLPAGNPQPADLGLTPTSLAYVIYTSGSTGKPKGVMNGHRGVVNRLLWARDEYGIDASDRILQKTPFSFDVSVWEFFLPLLAGARLVFARPGGHQDPAYLAELIETAGITTAHFVPSMLQLFVAHTVDAADITTRRYGSLRRILCSGEALPYALQQRCMQALPHTGLHNLYGPTEAAVDVT
ncbi:AMP-binding protein, partial [Paraburkholderia jirisanensis]